MTPGLSGRQATTTPATRLGFLAGAEPVPFATRAATDPSNYANNLNIAPSYVAGNVSGRSGGTGNIKSERVLTHNLRSQFWTGPLRSPERLQNTFAHESILDEVASAVGADPVAFRLKHLSDPRLIAVVKAAADAAKWDARPSPQRAARKTGVARGRGFSCVLYEGNNGYSAMVAEVDVDQDSGKILVRRFVVAQDCGPISNPDGLKNQLEGGVLQGMSRALTEEVTGTRRSRSTGGRPPLSRRRTARHRSVSSAVPTGATGASETAMRSSPARLARSRRDQRPHSRSPFTAVRAKWRGRRRA
jgi:CO/xanthine dehydrogenase Mo-binding subunit